MLYSTMQAAIFPGSFDPPTLGHVNIIQRALGIFDRLYVVVADNPGKHYSIPAETRCALIQRLTTPHATVEVRPWGHLIVDFAREVKAKIIIRGVRPFGDFDFEFQLSMINKGLYPDLETLFMPTDPRYFVLRSSSIKELVRLGADISTMVPPEIIDSVRELYSVDS